VSTSTQDKVVFDGVAVVLGSSPVRIWGMSSTERLRRQLLRTSVGDLRPDLASATGAARVLLLRADWAYEQRLIEALVESPDTVLLAPGSGMPIAANVGGADAAAVAEALLNGAAGSLPADHLRLLDPEGLGGNYNFKLRKREVGYVIPLTPQTLAEVENRTFAGSYKGVTDFVTKYVWPWPAKQVTRWCAERGITPNQVTLTGLVCVFIAFGLFWTGHYGFGLVFAWIMTFLDTVDGKLARVTMNYSRTGDILDHGIDLIHPPFWWWAWVVGLGAAGHADTWLTASTMIAIIFIGYIAQRVEEGIFSYLFGMHMHVWRRFDSFFRLITARRNPNLVILTLFTLIGEPGLGMEIVVWWIVICFFVHLSQIVQALVASRRQPITSWLSA